MFYLWKWEKINVLVCSFLVCERLDVGFWWWEIKFIVNKLFIVGVFGVLINIRVNDVINISVILMWMVGYNWGIF